MLGRGLRFKPLFIQHNFVVVVKLVATPNLMMIMEEVGCCSILLILNLTWVMDFLIQRDSSINNLKRIFWDSKKPPHYANFTFVGL